MFLEMNGFIRLRAFMVEDIFWFISFICFVYRRRLVSFEIFVAEFGIVTFI